jgi:hypothetical protein
MYKVMSFLLDLLMIAVTLSAAYKFFGMQALVIMIAAYFAATKYRINNV